ncbi:transmembrane amino acid transporter [Phyllosticta citrichinensis]|uniref:Transmembrane amino acid transporter n=1 Tax=Phyllosticta citrichinensis TaxID=1130410 RepID=A0ABR1XQ86_9PEZI
MESKAPGTVCRSDERLSTAYPVTYDDVDVFGDEGNHQIVYKTLSWQMVAVLMICEIVSNGMLSLPSSLAVVGIVPGLILIIFLGVFATYTAWLLVQFKLRHPDVHNMGDAGYILFGPIGREVLAFGTVLFAIFGTGSQMLAGEIALATLSDNKLCAMLYTGIFAIPILIFSFPRTFSKLTHLSIAACVSILVAGLVGMIGAGAHPTPNRSVQAAKSSNFYSAFVSITNPVFAYAGHFMFFTLVSEMRRPADAMKAAYCLQGFATTFYAIFAAVVYAYAGNEVASPSFSSLAPKWQKAAYGIALPNFLIAGALYSHTASKLFFVRLFRKSRHLHSHTVRGWAVWTALIVASNGAAFVLAVGVPIFNYLLGLVASLFAAWYTYGVAGFFWLHDAFYDFDGWHTWAKRWPQTSLAVLTIVTGAFICVAGTYVNVRGIVDAYNDGTVSGAFSC